jgi:hypothetical protein
MNSEGDFGAALVDVRKAYRLLYSFHRRIFDMVRAINSRAEAEGFAFELIEPSNEVPSGKEWSPNDVDQDYWEILPGYSIDFVWVKRSNPKHLDSTDRIFGIAFFADSAWGEIDDDYEAGPETYKLSAESSKTIAVFFLAKPLKPLDGVRLSTAWSQMYASNDMDPKPPKGGNYWTVQKIIDLETMTTMAVVVDAAGTFFKEAEGLFSKT